MSFEDDDEDLIEDESDDLDDDIADISNPCSERLYGKKHLEAFWRTYTGYRDRTTKPTEIIPKANPYFNDWYNSEYEEVYAQIRSFKCYHIWRSFELDGVFSFLNANSDDPVLPYLINAGMHPGLSKQHENELLSSLHSDDSNERADAFNSLCLANIRRVLRIVMYYLDSDIPVMDLVQEGNLGMTEAILTYGDKQRNTSFAKWVKEQVGKKVRRYIQDNAGICSLPRNIELACRKFKNQNAIEPLDRTSFSMLEELPGWNDMVREGFYLAICPPIEFFDMIEDGYVVDSMLSHDPTIVEDTAIRHISSEEVFKALNALSERERAIIMLRYGLLDGKQWTLGEMAKKYWTSSDIISKREVRARRKLERSLNHLLDG